MFLRWRIQEEQGIRSGGEGRQHFVDGELANLVKQHGPKWSKISGLLNRHQEDIRKRWEDHLMCGDGGKKDYWSREDEAVLIQHAIFLVCFLLHCV